MTTREDLAAAVKIGCILVTLFSIVLSDPLRQRRQAQESYIVDTLVVIDDVMYSNFQNWMVTASPNSTKSEVDSKLKEYVSLVIHQANVRLTTLQLSFSIRLQVANMSINESILGDLTDSQNQVNANSSLEVFRLWVVQHKFELKYDYVILLTGYTLQSDTYESLTKGRAYIGRMWDTNGYSTAIIQEDGGFQSAHFVAHEAGHNLGSQHDGEATSWSCSPQDGFIMSSVRKDVANQTNAWHFSNCSAVAVNKMITGVTSTPSSSSSSSNSYSTSLPPMLEFTSTANIAAGQLYPADVQCQMMYGSTSRVCLGSNFPNISDICTSMYCLDPFQSTSTSVVCSEKFAAEGTSCGDKKWCRMGKCESSDEAPALKSSCPNGDSVTLINGQTCADAIKSKPSQCYLANVRNDLCCRSCELARQASETCPYGDSVEGCTTRYCSTPYASFCCETCRQDVVDECSDVSSVDGLSCPDRAMMNQRQECYNATVASLCCQTCSKVRTNDTDCEYGDRYLDGTCTAGVSDTNCVSKGTDCCSTCNSASSIRSSIVVSLSAGLVIMHLFSEFVQYLF